MESVCTRSMLKELEERIRDKALYIALAYNTYTFLLRESDHYVNNFVHSVDQFAKNVSRFVVSQSEVPSILTDCQGNVARYGIPTVYSGIGEAIDILTKSQKG